VAVTLHRVATGHYEFVHDGERHTVTSGGLVDGRFAGWHVHRLGIAYVNTYRTMADVRAAFTTTDVPTFAQDAPSAYAEWGN
jgi:hypothetical protein